MIMLHESEIIAQIIAEILCEQNVEKKSRKLSARFFVGLPSMQRAITDAQRLADLLI